MSVYQSPFFGQLSLDKMEDFIEGKIECKGKKVMLDLNLFESESLSVEAMYEVDEFLRNLEKIEQEIRSGLKIDLLKKGVTKEYIDLLREYIDAPGIEKLLQNTNQMLEPDFQILSVIYLRRIGFYPEDDEAFAVFDYILEETLTDDLLVVVVSKKLGYRVTIES